RLSCINNLKQIGTAFHTYHDTYVAFPNSDNGGSITRSSAFTAILPYLEQGNTYVLYNFSLGNSDPANEQAVSQKISVYLCPSAVFRREVPILACDGNSRAPGTYAVSVTTDDPWGTYATGNPHNGAIVNTGSGSTGMRDLIDGSS